MTSARDAFCLASLVFLASFPAKTQTWSQLPASGTLPNSTGYASTNYDSANNILIAYVPEFGSPAQVWVLSNANGLAGTPTWSQLAPSGSPAVTNGGGTTVVYNPSTNEIIAYGGCAGNCSPVLSDVYVLSNANGIGGSPVWSHSSPNASIARTGQTAVFDPTTNSMITFGGDTGFYGTDHNDVNVLSPANSATPTWTTLATAGGPPPARDSASAVYDSKHNIMILFGGQQINSPSNIVDLNDVWVLSNANGQGGTPTWTQVTFTGDVPAPRSHFSAIYDGNAMYIWGGFSRSGANVSELGDVWKLTDANGRGSKPAKWSQVGQLGTPPGGNAVQGGVFDGTNKRIISFGGEDRNSNLFFDTFILDLEDN